VADIVKIYAKCVGLDPALFAGHSMRAGFLTSAAKRGASIFKMMDQSRHKSVETLRGYVRDAELFKDHAGTGLLRGLGFLVLITGFLKSAAPVRLANSRLMAVEGS
jgi:hypothetical protein